MFLILDDHVTAAENMSRDEALLDRFRTGNGVPVVRLYGWKPEAVSLGNSQTEADLDLDAVREYGLDIVQRGTGGGGILHNATEVTYAVILPIDHPDLTTNITQSFGLMSRGVVDALIALGLPAELESMPDRTRDALCYVRVQGTNVTVRGRKISGGAQRRTKWGVLQHGTVIVDRDDARASRIFRTDPALIDTKVTSTTIEGITPTRPELIDALVRGYGNVFGQLERIDYARLINA
ncbi:MAG: biotin/lipoate A/B protein ligase family protein [Kofleriaceae bacterium]